MKSIKPIRIFAFTLLIGGLIATLGGCDFVFKGDDGSDGDGGDNMGGAVYTMTNADGPNEVIAFERAADGTLTEAGRFATGGEGTGASIGGSQNALELSENGHTLFVVNAGSNELSVFTVGSEGLTLTDTAPTGGDTPISVTMHGDLVYVLNNNGGAGNITGFWLHEGNLEPISESTRTLSGDDGPAPPALPAQVGFSPQGDVLVVTERFSGPDDAGLIVTYPVGEDGRPSADPVLTEAPGRTPFGFAFGKHDQLVVTEAFVESPGNNLIGESAASSFTLSSDGTLAVNPGGATVGTFQTAACWTAIPENGRFAYVTNTASENITGFRIGDDGSLTRLDEDGITAETDAGPVDMAFSGDSRFLYVVNIGDGTINAFAADPSDGSLMPLEGAAGLPGSLFGLAAR